MKTGFDGFRPESPRSNEIKIPTESAAQVMTAEK